MDTDIKDCWRLSLKENQPIAYTRLRKTTVLISQLQDNIKKNANKASKTNNNNINKEQKTPNKLNFYGIQCFELMKIVKQRKKS